MAVTAEPPIKRPSARKVSPAGTRGALNMRIQPELRSLIDRAAEATGKNRTDFVLDAARKEAQQTLLDQVHVQLKPEAFAAFLHMLDAPVEPNENLRKTLRTPAPWE